eukprot:4310618-Alexandrium_andersonii.AAC.1
MCEVCVVAPTPGHGGPSGPSPTSPQSGTDVAGQFPDVTDASHHHAQGQNAAQSASKKVMDRYPSDVAQGPVTYSDVVATAFLEHLRSYQDHSPDTVFSMSPS